MICPTCGAPVAVGERRCPYCGAALPAKASRLDPLEETQLASSIEDAYTMEESDRTELAENPEAGGTAWMRRTRAEQAASSLQKAQTQQPRQKQPTRKKETRRQKQHSSKPAADQPNNRIRIVLLVILAILIVVLILRG